MTASQTCLVLHDNSAEAGQIRKLLQGLRGYRFGHIDKVRAEEVAASDDLLVVVDLAAKDIVSRLKRLPLRNHGVNSRHVFAIRQGSRREAVQASALGATATVTLPLTIAAIATAFGAGRPKASRLWLDEPEPLATGLTRASEMVSTLLAPNLVVGPGFDHALTRCAEAISQAIEEMGIGAWLRAVRGHHSHTFRHCLLVAGHTAAFGQQLQFSRRDRNLLLVAGLLHDVGKSEIPLEILDKPGRLDDDEMTLMRTHSGRGYDLLKASGEVGTDVLDVVRHHHEMLDGSGYPDRLIDKQIGDLVRLATIADIYSALVETRAYKTPMPPMQAWTCLKDMGPRLDQPLVDAFRPIAVASAQG